MVIHFPWLESRYAIMQAVVDTEPFYGCRLHRCIDILSFLMILNFGYSMYDLFHEASAWDVEWVLDHVKNCFSKRGVVYFNVKAHLNMSLLSIDVFIQETVMRKNYFQDLY